MRLVQYAVKWWDFDSAVKTSVEVTPNKKFVWVRVESTDSHDGAVATLNLARACALKDQLQAAILDMMTDEEKG